MPGFRVRSQTASDIDDMSNHARLSDPGQNSAVVSSQAEYDAPVPARLDPAIRAANLAALLEVDPKLAQVISAVERPEHWRAVWALDGALTFRLERAGEPPAWLSGTAAPDTRAKGSLDGYDPAGKNPALPCAGAGGEIRWLLSRLPPHLALFVFEQDPVAIAAVLELLDVAQAIGDRRLIFVPPANAMQALSALLDVSPGLLPPGTILAPLLAGEARLAEVKQLCDRVHTETALARQRALLAIQQMESQRETSGVDPPRLALIAMTLDRVAQAQVGLVRAAAESEGWPTEAALLRSSADAHGLGHAARLARFAPSLSLWAGHDASVLGVALAGEHVQWVQRARLAPAGPAPDVKYLAASPCVEEALTRAGIPGDAIVPWYWACDRARLAVPAGAAGDSGDTIVVVGDLPPMDAETIDLTLDSQKSLWEQIRRVVRLSWESELMRWPERVLSLAEREASYTVRDRALRDQFLKLTAEIAIPGESLLQIVATLRAAGCRVSVVGSGWRNGAGAGIEVLARDATDLPIDVFQAPSARPRGLVFAGSVDPLTPALVDLAACGLPMALHAPGGVGLDATLGDVLTPQRDLHAFATRQQLMSGVEFFATSGAQRRAERTRERLAGQHTWNVRVRALRARPAHRH